MIKHKMVLQGRIIGDLVPKCGLDANVLVDLILYPNAKKYFKEHGYSFPHQFLCTLPQCIGECKGVLINKYGFTLQKANDVIDALLDDFMVQKLPFVSLNDDIIAVEGLGKKHGLNDEDLPIIYGFWKLKITLVVSRDNAFEATCEELNINVIRWPLFI